MSSKLIANRKADKLVVKNKSIFLSVCKKNFNAEKIMQRKPLENEEFRIMSLENTFSAINILSYLCNFGKDTIDEFYGSTFRIGKNEMKILCQYKINKLLLICNEIMKKQNQDKYVVEHFKLLEDTATANGWKILIDRAHAKLYMMKIGDNYYIVETSANLNKNNKIEQYVISNDKKIYEFYKENFFKSYEDKQKGEDVI